MEINQRRFQNSLAIAISCFIVVFPAYLCFSSLLEVNVSSTDMSFENPDQDCQFADQKYESDTLPLAGAFPIRFLPGLSPFERSHHSYLPETSLNQKACILRC